MELALALDNEDILIEIFLRLPVKSLIRFKCVCKKWRIVISSDYFCHRHTPKAKVMPSLILQIHRMYNFPQHHFYLDPTLKVMIPYSLSVSVPGYKIMQACNGLLLLEQFRCHDNPSDEIERLCPARGHYVVYNPTTRQSREIGGCYVNCHSRFEDVCLAFDPLKSPHYKIVLIQTAAKSDSVPDFYTYDVVVYESESHSWRRVRLEAAFSFPRITHGVHCDNAIYWMSAYERGFCYFDISRDEMKTMSFPQPPQHFTSTYSQLQESDGRLYLLQFMLETSEEGIPMAVWELEMGGDGDHPIPNWLLKHHGPVNDSQVGNLTRGILRIMNRDGDGDGGGTCALSLLTCRHQNDGNKIRAYNLVDQSCEDIVNFLTQPLFPRQWAYVKCFQFGETLALV